MEYIVKFRDKVYVGELRVGRKVVFFINNFFTIGFWTLATSAFTINQH